MAYEDVEDDAEEMEEESSSSRRVQPRFGPFLTIAVAILMLFGAASRVGKDTESGGWLDADVIAKRDMEQESLRQHDERIKTLVTLGSVPGQENRNTVSRRDISLNNRVLPPSRADNGVGVPGGQNNFLRPLPMASSVAPIADDYDEFSEGDFGGRYFDPAPEASPQPRAAGNTYVVKAGDNWIKIGKKTNRNWRDIEKLNPESRDGLRVGMRLTLPGD